MTGRTYSRIHIVGGGSNAVAALLRVDGMTGAGKAYAGGNKGTCSDVYRRGIQNDTVIIDDRQAVGMDVEAIVTVEIRLNAGHGRAGGRQIKKENNRREPDKISGLYQWLEILNMFKISDDW